LPTSGDNVAPSGCCKIGQRGVRCWGGRCGWCCVLVLPGVHLGGCWGESAGSDCFDQVVHQGVEAEFGCSSGDSAAREAAEAEIVFGMSEWGFGDVAALAVEGMPVGGA
jgi:hypothetical protein